MKLRPVANPGNIKKTEMTSFRKIVMSLSFLRFMTNLEQSGSPILNAWSVKLTFSLRVSLQRMKKELKNLEHSYQYCYLKIYFLKLQMCVY